MEAERQGGLGRGAGGHVEDALPRCKPRGARHRIRILISKQTLSREVGPLGYRKLSARPRHHAKSEAEVSAFERPSPPSGGDHSGDGQSSRPWPQDYIT